MPLVGEMYRTERTTLVQGDCLDVLRCLEDGKADALVTDPPSGTGFMNKSWDSFKSRDAFVDFLGLRLAECRRVCRPGAVGLVWALPRTSHWTALAIEEAGWIIEDRIAHMFGCLSDDTEILTESGWEPYHKIGKGSIALTYNIGDDTFCWEPIQEVYTYDYCDTAYRIYSDRTDQLVSRNHRCIIEQGGAYTFAYAETLALEQEICVPVLEDMRDLLEALPVRELETVESQQNVLASLYGTEDRNRELRKKETGPGLSEVWYVIQTDGEGSKGSGQIPLLQNCMCGESKSGRSDIPQTPEGNICEGEGRLDGGFPSLLSCEDEWREQSVLEGGSNLLQKARELSSSKVCSLSSRFSADGEEGRLCNGASGTGGQGFGMAATEGRSGSPLRPQPQKQCYLQSDAVCLESGPQTVRASRFTRADLARVEPVHYRGIVWCVKVPSGAFIARRNGKVFVTGNSGFPKHKSKLKPACEDWWLCRNPGPLWLGVEECRIGTNAGWSYPNGRGGKGWGEKDSLSSNLTTPMQATAGRYPANTVFSHHPECVCQGTKKVKGGNGVRGSDSGNKMYGGGKGFNRPSTGQVVGYADADGIETVENWTCHPDCPIRLLNEQAGESRSSASPRRSDGSMGYGGQSRPFVTNGYNDSGGPSRFFYCSKSSKKDRGEGNVHPTVKSTSLMSWLVKLACPEGGLVLDPFAGSGSTGVACLRTGRRFLGVESDRESCLTAVRRLRAEEEIT
jgi:DNA methylase